jgi:NTP pyrophosphatase (non-canonical NTP hydrolase)
MDKIGKLTAKVDEFANERDWEQFHSPKNLCMALAGEVGELVAEFQWLTEEQSTSLTDAQLGKAKDEIGDVFILLLRLCSRLKVDPIEAASEKIQKNAEKYPVEKARGSAKKYTEL